jgi:hypothetical protein
LTRYFCQNAKSKPMKEDSSVLYKRPSDSLF